MARTNVSLPVCEVFQFGFHYLLHLAGDKVNIENEHHQGTAHVQIDHCHISWMATCNCVQVQGAKYVGYATKVGSY